MDAITNQLPKLTTGKAIAKSLVAHGVETVFGIPGAHMYHFSDALAKESAHINFITTRHEQGAGHMAYGYAVDRRVDWPPIGTVTH